MANAMRIDVHKATPEELRRLNCASWPIWACGVSKFDYFYDDKETCHVLEGQVTVSAEGQTVSFGPGDIVIFPKGLSCVWDVTQPVRKHYRFGE